MKNFFLLFPLLLTPHIQGKISLKNLAVYGTLLCAPATIQLGLPCCYQAYQKVNQQLGKAAPWVFGTLACALYHIYPARKIPVAQPRTKLGYLELTTPFTTSNQFYQALQRATQDQQIEGIIIKIDAQQADLGLCTSFFHELKKVREKKPVIALIERACLREPYLIACAAQTIIANEQALVGGIGLLFPLIKQKDSPDKELYYFYAGKYAPWSDSRITMSPEESNFTAQLLQERYQQLCTHIAQERKISLASQEIWANGQPFTGNQAMRHKLIDQIGTLSDAYTTMEKLLAERNIICHPIERIPLLEQSSESEK